MPPRTRQKSGQSAVQKIPQYKNEIIGQLLQSEMIVKLLSYDSTDALFRDKPSDDKISSLIYDRIFPYRFVPNPIEDVGTYITLGMSGFTPHMQGYDMYDDFQNGTIYFYIFTHIDIMQTDSGVRTDLIVGEIDRIFNGYTGGLGMGELKLNWMTELWMHNNKFGGYNTSYTLTDFK